MASFVDFGPVPISKLKDQSDGVYAALKEDRRVLLSRHGHVVAAIEPPTDVRYESLILDFVTQPDGGVPELRTSDLSQNPSEAVRRAEKGIETVLTHQGKVRGILTSKPELESRKDAARRASAIKEFAEHSPNATPEEFAHFVESLGQRTQDAVAAQWITILTGLKNKSMTVKVRSQPQDKNIKPDVAAFARYKKDAMTKVSASASEVKLLTVAAKMVPEILHLTPSQISSLSVAEVNELRSALEEAGTYVELVKRRLTSDAGQGAGVLAVVEGGSGAGNKMRG